MTNEIAFKSITDNTPTPKDDFGSIPALVKKIANKTLAQLATERVFVFPELEDADDLTKDQMILRSVNNDYWSGNVMGFLGYEEPGVGKQRLEIRSRFSTPSGNNAGEHDASESYDYFLIIKVVQSVLNASEVWNPEFI